MWPFTLTEIRNFLTNPRTLTDLYEYCTNELHFSGTIGTLFSTIQQYTTQQQLEVSEDENSEHNDSDGDGNNNNKKIYLVILEENTINPDSIVLSSKCFSSLCVLPKLLAPARVAHVPSEGKLEITYLMEQWKNKKSELLEIRKAQTEHIDTTPLNTRKPTKATVGAESNYVPSNPRVSGVGAEYLPPYITPQAHVGLPTPVRPSAHVTKLTPAPAPRAVPPTPGLGDVKLQLFQQRADLTQTPAIKTSRSQTPTNKTPKRNKGF